MSDSDWPDLPLVFSQGIPFLLVSGYTRFGAPPDVKAYVGYCRSNGVFRTEPYKFPCMSDCLVAIRALSASERWARIKWVDAGEGWSYGYDELIALHVSTRRWTA